MLNFWWSPLPNWGFSENIKFEKRILSSDRLLVPRRYAADWEENETGTLQPNFLGWNYGHRSKRCSTFGDHCCQIEVVCKSINFEKRIRAQIECSPLEDMLETWKNWDWDATTEVFGVKYTAIAPNDAQHLVINVAKLSFFAVNWYWKTDYGLSLTARTQTACHRLGKKRTWDSPTELFGV